MQIELTSEEINELRDLIAFRLQSGGAISDSLYRKVYDKPSSVKIREVNDPIL